ncbi:potassium channel-like protein [Cucurbitaria berberidis CBS 394.84]|uniref:Potassium channel-like protein n=1 Tax=Cucurbitaria berberidis CBS 394.84 TaxID=1168544 RepID=A0A9P4GTE4_9PLEO|nr:potassium channel-like protein [Cucurbitaria berberidis CBS 394.84]KAF1850721.1 potassium channel-like protein [Cucurbitaria berberidis CBS 394.84]
MVREELQEPEKPPPFDGSDATRRVQEEHQSGIKKLDESLSRKGKRSWAVWKRWKEGEESDWWFASTGIPLLAATLGPLANVSSIAALVTSWRQTNYVNGVHVPDFDGVPYTDPRWCYWINVASLICGFLGNIFLLLNFTQRIRYIVALPASIIFWYLSSGFLIAITVCMEMYDPPNRPQEGYTQGFWYAIAAATFYTICSMILMFNMLGYFLGHYPENFALSDSQRTLILQTMAFFIWLGGGAALFSKIERDAGEDAWGFSDGLYFCDVTILTVGFGDLVPTTDVARGIVFPYSVGGIITLALIVSSLYKAVRELGEEKIVQKHVDRMRERALERTVTNSFDFRHREHEAHRLIRRRTLGFPRISAPTELRPYRTAMDEPMRHIPSFPRGFPEALKRRREPKLILLKEEKDRFEAMRQIQAGSKKFRRWMALMWSVATFSTLWCVGAIVFWQAEKETQAMTYFQALYFCYISLLTIGYGDLAPKSNAGRCFFVIWSLIAVPTMTILVSDLGDTVVFKFKKWSDQVADFTRRIETRAAKKRLKKGFDTIDPRTETTAVTPDPTDRDVEDSEVAADVESTVNPTIVTLAAEAEQDLTRLPSHASLSRRLAISIKKVSIDFRLSEPKRYSYEEWVEFTRLIRLTTPERLNHYLGTVTAENEDENEEGLVNWDWIGDDSPMMSTMSESEWLLERLCESLVRLEKRKEMACDQQDIIAMRPAAMEPT